MPPLSSTDALPDPSGGRYYFGNGSRRLVDHIAIRHSIEYADIPDFPVSTVEGHKGRLIFGELGGRRIVAMQGVSTIMRDIRRSRWSSLSG